MCGGRVWPRKLRTLYPYLQREHLRVERQAHTGQLVAFRGGAATAAAAASSFSATTLNRHQRQRDLERARLLHQALALEPGAPHRVGARELAPPAAGGGGAEDAGRVWQEVEDALDGGEAGEAHVALLPVLVEEAPLHLLDALISGVEALLGASTFLFDRRLLCFTRRSRCRQLTVQSLDRGGSVARGRVQHLAPLVRVTHGSFTTRLPGGDGLHFAPTRARARSGAITVFVFQ